MRVEGVKMRLEVQLGRYQTLHRLAAGGMAEVFLAQLPGALGFSKTVVIKRIHPHLAEDPEVVEMFRREALVAAKLSHPNLVHIHDFGIDDGAPYLVMEYVDGLTLYELLSGLLSRGEPLPPPVAARIVSDACEGLQSAHDLADESGAALSLVHRDISLDNVLVARSGAVKIVDFGIARIAGQIAKTQPGVVRGKLPYMAPEQMRGEELDRRTDVFALGVVLYTLLTGSRPFHGDTDAMTMHHVLFSTPAPLKSRRPDLPPMLQPIIDKVLAKDRRDRFETCRALQFELESFIVAAGEVATAGSLAELVKRVAPPPPPSHVKAEDDGRAATPLSQRPDAHTEVEAKAPALEPAATKPSRSLTVDPAPRESTAALVRAAVRPNRGPLFAAVALLLGGSLLAAGLLIDWGGTTPLRAPVAPPVASAPPLSPQAIELPPAPMPQPPPVELPRPAVKRPARRAGPEPADSPLPPPPPTPPAEQQMATLKLWVRPFAAVSIDGRPVGNTPLPPLRLAEGPHTLTLFNAELGKTHEVHLEVRGEQVYKFSFEQ